MQQLTGKDKTSQRVVKTIYNASFRHSDVHQLCQTPPGGTGGERIDPFFIFIMRQRRSLGMGVALLSVLFHPACLQNPNLSGSECRQVWVGEATMLHRLLLLYCLLLKLELALLQLSS